MIILKYINCKYFQSFIFIIKVNIFRPRCIYIIKFYYTFKDEIDETKSSAVLNNYVYGVTRKCTPFEKKDFAGRANQELDNAHSVAMDNYGKLMNIRRELNTKSKEVTDE